MLVEVWLTTSVVGLAAAVYGVIEAIKDARVLPRAVNGRRLVARQRLFAMCVRVAIFASFAVLGMLTFGRPEPPATLPVLILIGANIAWVLVTITDVYVGWRLRRI